MNRNDYVNGVKNEIVNIARRMLTGDCGLIEGARSLAELSHEINANMDREFSVFHLVASETDDVPCGELRNNWDKEALVELDESLVDYLTKIKSSVDDACRLLIEKYKEG